jgi:hypothetical protein
MGRDRRTKGHDTNRISGGFIALPWQVVDSAAYMGLSYPAKALLIEIDRQYVRDNNGRLLASRAHLLQRGWKSQDVISRALRELIDAKLIHKTVQGHFPKTASWFAVTWRKLDRMPGYDTGAVETFQLGGFVPMVIKNASLKPSDGTDRLKTVPSGGAEGVSVVPSSGPIRASFSAKSVPFGGHHLDTPSALDVLGQNINNNPVGVPDAVTRKAAKHLTKLARGKDDEKVIRAGRGAGLTIEQLIEWSDAETVERSLAAGVLPYRDLWMVTA